jgi:protein-S-isoprenylcysteine O-methyltransferase Ste14
MTVSQSIQVPYIGTTHNRQSSTERLRTSKMPESKELMSRVKRPSPLGTSLFIGLRSLDPFLQYGILGSGLAAPILNALNVSTVHSSSPLVALELPLKPLIVLAMAAGTTIKQVYWVAYLSNEEMPTGNSIIISIFNTVFNSANSILSLTAAAKFFAPSFLTNSQNENEFSPLFILGSVSYTIGLVVEAVSETRRKKFKDDPKNKGMAYTGGLFGLARHINYGAYTVMRSGYALASGGWIWGSFVAIFFGVDFARRGVPILDEYCTKRVSLLFRRWGNDTDD